MKSSTQLQKIEKKSQRISFFTYGKILYISCIFLASIFFQEASASDLYPGVQTNTIKKTGMLRIPTLNEMMDAYKKQRVQGAKLRSIKTIASLSESNDIQLQKLSEYKKNIVGNYGNEMMIFLNMPLTERGIENLAQNMSNIILEYKKNRVNPIFLFEPYDENHREINFEILKNGGYEAQLGLLFSKLKDTYLIQADDIGFIVPYPEINTPAYKRIGFSPNDFSVLINSFFTPIRKVYPTIQAGILLDSKTYEIGETWGGGSYVSFLPYIKDIAPGTIQRFGIQGFPWVSKNGSIKAYDPKEYLPSKITLEAAKYLGANSIWYNTGVMKRKYHDHTIVLSPETYSIILTNLLLQAKTNQEKGFEMSVHIFSQNKFNFEEVTDWSILGEKPYESQFEKFLTQAEKSNIMISIFDK